MKVELAGARMNIRRGLFRLWLVLSGLWLLFAGAIHYDELMKPYFTPRGYYFPKDIAKAAAQAELDKRAANSAGEWGTFEIKTPDGFTYSIAGANRRDAFNRLANAEQYSQYAASPVMVEKYTAAYDNLEEGMLRGGIDQIAMVDLPEIVLFVGAKVPEAEKTRQAAEVHRLGTAAKDAVVSRKRAEALPRMALFGTLPPAILFALGWLVLWIVRGFRTA